MARLSITEVVVVPMETYLSFFLEHWVLSSAFVVLLLLFIFNEWRHFGGSSTIAPQELVDLLNHSRGVVLDIRNKDGFDQGHIIGAINIPQSEIDNRKNLLTKHKAKPVVVVCQNGQSSPKVQQLLLKEGFKEVYCLRGGMGLWKDENFPVSKH